MAGSNDLNISLKAQVVKLKVELDAKGSKLPQQVNNISKMLANNPVKLKVKLEAKLGDLSKQLKTIGSTLENNKALKPMKIAVEIDTKGSAVAIKKQLQDIYKVVGDFNKKYGEQVKKMQEQVNKAQTAKGKAQSSLNIPTGSPVGNFNNIKQYTAEIEKAKNILNSKFGDGIFKATQFKDAKGNLQGFVAELQKANGIVEKIKYSWNGDKNKFEVISRQTVDSTNKNAQSIQNTLKTLKSEINNLGKGADKGSLLTQLKDVQKALATEGGKGFNKQMVVDLQSAIKSEQQLVQATKSQNNMLQQQKQLIYDIKKARDSAQSSAKNDLTKLLAEANKANKADNPALAFKEIRLAMQGVLDTQSKSIAKQKEEMAITKERIKIQRQLKDMLRQAPSENPDGKLQRSMIQSAIQANSLVRTYEQLAQSKKKLDSLQSNKWMDADQQKARKLVEDLKAVQRQLNEVGKGTKIGGLNQQVQLFDSQIAKKLSVNTQDVRNALTTYTRMLTNAKQEIRNKEKQIRLGEDISAKFGADKIQSMQNILFQSGGKSQQAIQQLQGYIREVERAKVASVSFGKDSTDAMGKVVKSMSVVFQGKGDFVRKVTYNMTEGSNQIRQVSDEMVRNVNRNLGAWEKLRVMMSSAPIFMLSQAMFTAPIQGLQAMTQEILKVDTAMTELRRVTSDSQNVDILFQNAVGLSAELGNNIHDIMKGMNEFARTFGDFNERQLTAITKTATLMSNVSDLSVEDAQKSLVGTMNAFNIEASDSIGIVDKLNEVDNNYAISTQQLAEGLQKSASAGKTFGVGLEENIGHITAIGSVTMESGAIIGNSLKTIYSRLTTMKDSEKTLNDVGVAMYEIGQNGEKSVRPVSKILNDLSKEWNTLSAEEQQNTAVKIAGRNQLTRFLALMNNYPTAIEATTTAYNSQGSAMRENAEYMKSFDARLNQLKNGFTEVSLAFGDAFLSGGMLAVIDGLGAIAKGVISVTQQFGALSSIGLILGGIATKMGLFKGLFETMGRGFTTFTNGFKNSTTQANGFVGTLNRVRDGVTAVGSSAGASRAGVDKLVGGFLNFGKSLLAMTGMGLIFMGIGAGVEYLIGKYQEAKREQEEIEKTTNQMIDSYRKNSDNLDGLVTKFDRLNQAFQAGQIKEGTTEYNEFLQVQSKLAEIMPSMVDHIDSQGQAWMRSSSELKEQISLTKELSKAKAEEMKAKYQENIDKQVDSLEKLRKKQKEIAEEKKQNEIFKESPTATQSREERLDAYDKKVTATNIKQKTLAVEIAQAQQKITQELTNQARAGLEADGNLQRMSDSAQKVVDNFMKINGDKIGEAIRKGASGKELDTLFKNLTKGGEAVGQIFADNFKKMTAGINEGTAEGAKKIDEIKNKLGSIGKAIPPNFLKVENLGDLDKVKEKVQGLIDLGAKIKDGASGADFSGYVKSAEALGMSTSEATKFVTQLGNESKNAELKARAQAEAQSGVSSAMDSTTDSMGNATDATKEYADAVIQAIDVQKQLFGYKNEELSAMQGHIETLKMSQLLYGDNASKTKEWGESVSALADRLGVSKDEISGNIDQYYGLINALGQLKTKYDENGKVVLDYGSMTDGQKEKINGIIQKMQEKGVKIDFLTGKESEFGKATENTNQKLDENGNKIDEHGNKIDQAGNKISDTAGKVGESADKMTPYEKKMKDLETQSGTTGETVSQNLGKINLSDFSQVQAKAQELGISMDEVVRRAQNAGNQTPTEMSKIGNSGGNLAPLGTAMQTVNDSFDGTGKKAGETAGAITNSFGQIGNAGAPLNNLNGNLDTAKQKMDETKQNVETNVGGINTAFGQLGTGLNTGFMTPFQQITQNFNNEMNGMAKTTGSSAQQISNDAKTIMDAKTGLEGYATAVNSVGTSMSSMATQVTGTATGLSQFGMAFAGASQAMQGFIGLQTQLQGSMQSTVSTAQSTGATLEQVGTSISNAGASAGSFVSAMDSVGASCSLASQSMANMGSASATASSGLASASQASYDSANASNANANAKYNEANASQASATASYSVAGSKQAEANAIMSAISATQQMAGAYASMASAGMSSISSMTSAIQSFVQSVQNMASAMGSAGMTVISIFDTMSGSVKGSTSAMVSAHNSQVSALNAVKSAADSARSAVTSLNSTISGAMSSLSTYIAKANEASNVQVKAPSLPSLPVGASWVMQSITNLLGGQSEESGSGEVASAVGSLGSAMSSAIGSFTASSGESSSLGGGGGTSGTIQPSIYSGLNSNGEYGVFKTLADDSEKLADATPWNSYKRQISEFDVTIKWMEAKMKSMNKYTAEYRDMMNQIYQVEIKRWQVLNNDLYDKERRNEQIKRELEGLKNINSHTKEQREQYNKLWSEYESNLTEIQSMRAEWQEFLDNWENRYAEILMQHVQAIVEEYTKGLEQIKAKVDDIDFNISVAELVDPDNMTKMMNLYIDKANQLKQERDKLGNQQRDLTYKLYEAQDRFGKDSQVAKDIQAEIDKVKEAWEDSALSVLQAEKEIKDARAKVADDGINQLKTYYKNMKDMAVDAIDKEQEHLKKAHEEKMKLYDKEIEKINSVYDAKLKEMDKQKDEDSYNKDLQEKNDKRAELQNKISILSKDTSLGGKKKLEDAKKELADMEKEIAQFQKDRQDELMRQALEDQKNQQLKEIEDKKKADEEALNKQVDDLDKEKADVSKKYDDLLENDKYWADMRDQFIQGSFNTLTNELIKMKDSLNLMNQGIFDGLTEGFKNFSEEVKKQVQEANDLIVDNMNFNSDGAMSDVAEILSAKGYRKFEDEVIRPEDPARPPKPAPEPPPKPTTPPTSSGGGGQSQLPTKGNVTGVSSDSYLNIRNAPNMQGSVVRRILNGANVQILGEDGDWWKIRFSNSRGTTEGYANKKYIKAFDTGGYTGDNVPKDGALALLHNKELVLNERQTSDLLDTVKVLDRVKGLIPSLSPSNLASQFASSGGVNVTNNYELNVNIERLNGDKEGANTVVKEIMKGLKKMGK